MPDIIGPSAAAPNAVTTRPADSRVFGPDDSWFRDCTGPDSGDGTDIQAGFLNGLLGLLRTATRGMGIADTGPRDNLLRDAIRMARLRVAAAAGGVDALTCAFSPPHVTWDGAAFLLLPAAVNTGGPMTISIDGLPPRPLRHAGGVPPAGLLRPGHLMLCAYDGTQVQVVAATGGSGGSGGGVPSAGPALKVFHSSGTWTREAGSTWAAVIACGAGGAGGGGNGSTEGGGAGETRIALIDVSAITSVSVTIAPGGAGGMGAGGDGGGGTSFGSHVVAMPGRGGRVHSGAGSPSSSQGGEGGTGGIGFRGNDGGSGGHGTPGNGGAGFFGGSGYGGNDTMGKVNGRHGAHGGGGGGGDGFPAYGGNGGAGVVVVLEW